MSFDWKRVWVLSFSGYSKMAEIIELHTTQKRNRNNSLPNSKTNKTAQKKQKLDSSGILDQDNSYNIIPIYQKAVNDPVGYIVFDQTDKIKSIKILNG